MPNLSLDQQFKITPDTRLTDKLLLRLLRAIEIRLAPLEGRAGAFDAAEKVMKSETLGRVNEVLNPAIASLEELLVDVPVATVNGQVGDVVITRESLEAAPEEHTHVIADVVNLASVLADKAAAVHTHEMTDILGLLTALGNKAESAHTHAQADITGLTAALGAKATKASPALTGTPTAPTASNGTNTTQIATTAFVQSALSSSNQTMLADVSELFIRVAMLQDDRINMVNGIADPFGDQTDVDTGQNLLATYSNPNDEWTISNGGNGRLQSTAFVAGFVPSSAKLSLIIDPIDVITINTDVIGEVSRDNGTTWTAVTLSLVDVFATDYNFYEGSATISGQPSGSNMKYRVRTVSKSIKIKAVALKWS
jgi:hypothetical protein